MVHTLTFSNISANFVKDKDLIGQQDPYIVFELGTTRTQTKAIKGAGTHASWKDSYTLEKADISPNSSELVAAAYNHNTLLPDGLLGTGKINLSSLDESSFTGSSTSIPLFDKKGARVGELSLTINGGGYKGRGTSSTGATGGARGVTAGAGIAGVAAGAAGAGAHHHTTHDARSTRDKLTKDDYTTGTGTGINSGTRGVDTTRGTTGTDGTRGVDTTRGTTGTGHGVTTGTGTTTGVRGETGDVIDRKYYTSTEDRPIDQELVEKYREHNPYEKEYKTTVQSTGRERQLNSNVEALGTQERVIGVGNVLETQPHAILERNLPAGYKHERPGGEGWTQGKAGPVCEEKHFTIAGDRPVEKERVTALKEHRNFEKEFEVKTQLEGERQVGQGSQTELLDREKKVVGVHKTTPCEGHPEI